MKYDNLSVAANPDIDHETRACMNLWAEVFRVGVQDTALAASHGNFEYYWFVSAERHPGSFLWLCDLFGIDPDIARGKIRARFRTLFKETKDDAGFEDEIRSEMADEVSADPVEVDIGRVGVRSSLRAGRSKRQPKRKG